VPYFRINISPFLAIYFVSPSISLRSPHPLPPLLLFGFGRFAPKFIEFGIGKYFLDSTTIGNGWRVPGGFGDRPGASARGIGEGLLAGILPISCKIIRLAGGFGGGLICWREYGLVNIFGVVEENMVD